MGSTSCEEEEKDRGKRADVHTGAPPSYASVSAALVPSVRSGIRSIVERYGLIAAHSRRLTSRCVSLGCAIATDTCLLAETAMSCPDESRDAVISSFVAGWEEPWSR
jgi:hypothetical protein